MAVPHLEKCLSFFAFSRVLKTDCHGKTNTHKRVVPCLVPDEFSSPEQMIISSPVEMLLAYCWQQLREWVFGEARREIELRRRNSWLTGAIAGLYFILNKLNLLASLNLLERICLHEAVGERSRGRRWTDATLRQLVSTF